MNYQDYYLHGTGGYKGIYCALDRIGDILKSGKLLIQKNRVCVDYTIRDDKKRIYLCDLTRPKIANFDSAYNLYISHSPTLVLKRNFEVITPICSADKTISNAERSNLYDEVRCPNDISLDNLVAVLLPIKSILDNYHLEIEKYLNINDDDEAKYKIKKNVIKPSIEKLTFMKNAFLAVKEFDTNLPILEFQTQNSVSLSLFNALEENIEKAEVKKLTR